MKRLFSSFLLLGVLTSCGGEKLNRDNFELVRQGMTKEQVEQILGQGQSNTTNTRSGEVVSWKSGFKIITISFVHGEVSRKNQVGL